MGRTMKTPRTGKRSKKEKNKHKSKSDENELHEASSISGLKEGDAKEGREMDDHAPEEINQGAENVDASIDEENLGEEEGGLGREGEEEDLSERDAEEEGEGQEEVGLEGEEESDEAPEDISLAEGKVKALERQKDEGDQIKRVKASAKQKRKHKYELFKKQKEAKKLRKVTKFSEEGLEEVVKKMAEERAVKKAEEKRKKRLKKALDSSDVPPECTELEVGGAKVILLGEESSDGDDKITLRTSTGYEAASNFLRQSLYGDKHKRLPALTLQAKRYRNQPAKNFVQS